MDTPVFMVCVGDDDHNKQVYATHIRKFHSRLNWWDVKTAQEAARILSQRQSALFVLTNEQFAAERTAIAQLVKTYRGKVAARAVVFGKLEPALNDDDGFGKDVVYWRQRYGTGIAAE